MNGALRGGVQTAAVAVVLVVLVVSAVEPRETRTVRAVRPAPDELSVEVSVDRRDGGCEVSTVIQHQGMVTRARTGCTDGRVQGVERVGHFEVHLRGGCCAAAPLTVEIREESHLRLSLTTSGWGSDGQR